MEREGGGGVGWEEVSEGGEGEVFGVGRWGRGGGG